MIRAARHLPPKIKKESTGSLLLLPIIGSNPAIGFMVGVGGQYAFKMYGDQTLYSAISGSAQYTTKNQILFLMKNNIYSKNNRIFYSGDWRYQIFLATHLWVGNKFTGRRHSGLSISPRRY
ncbi:MAG: hypothetical protein U5K54_13585 [Cytophagales bacterium]|nr:hypothetical protein [Cytophagales bacterium]